MRYALISSFVVTGLGLILAPIAARAADMPAGIAVYPEIVQSSSVDWSGFYAGFNLGYGLGNADPVDVTAFPGAAGATFGAIEPEGWQGGLQAGVNMQRGNLVFGLEGDLQLSDITGTATASSGGVTATGTMDLDWSGALRPRIGVSTGPALIYATGGLAFGGLAGTVDVVGAAGETSTLTTSGDIAFGYTLGGGVEYALSDSISIKGEYQFTHLSAEARGRVYDAAGTDLGLEPNSWINADTHTIKAGLNFHF